MPAACDRCFWLQPVGARVASAPAAKNACQCLQAAGPDLWLPCTCQLLLPGCHCCSNCDRHDVHLQIIYFGREVRQPEALTKMPVTGGTCRLLPVGSFLHQLTPSTHRLPCPTCMQHCPAQRHDVQACPICSWAAARGSGSSGSKSESKSKQPAKPKRKAAEAVTEAATAVQAAAAVLSSEAAAAEAVIAKTPTRRRRRL